MKWIGQHIWSLISRFRSDVYIENLSTTTETNVLVVDSSGKVSKNTTTVGGDITGVTAGNALTGGGTSGALTINHEDTSSQASVDNSGSTYVQDVTLDTYGHVTGLVSAAIPTLNQDTSGEAGTVATIAGLAPNTATTQATQAAITTCTNLVTVGTIGTGVWQGTAVASAYLDSDTAHLTTAQTFSGSKTMGTDVKLNFRDANSYIHSPDANDLEIVATDIVLDAAANIALEVGAVTNYVDTAGILRGTNIGTIQDTFIPIVSTDFNNASSFRYPGYIAAGALTPGIKASHVSAFYHAVKVIPNGYTATSVVIYGLDADEDSTIRCYGSNIQGASPSALAAAVAFDNSTTPDSATFDFGANDVIGGGDPAKTVIIEWNPADTVDQIFGGKIIIEKT